MFPYIDTTPGTWSSTSTMSSTLWLVASFDSWCKAIRFTEDGRRGFEKKPNVRRVGDRWVVRYAPRIFAWNAS